MTEKIEVREEKLRKTYYYLEERIRLFGLHKIENPSLLQEYKNLLYLFEEELILTGDYPKKLREEIKKLSKHILLQEGAGVGSYNQDINTIIISLQEYQQRIKHDIFSNFFSDKQKKGIYRIDVYFLDDKPPRPYKIYAFSELDAILELWKIIGEFHLQNPREDVIYIGDCKGGGCKSLYLDKKNDQNYRCKLLRSACSLAHGGEKFKCPNLEELVGYQEDLFEKFINEEYTTIDRSQKYLSTS